MGLKQRTRKNWRRALKWLLAAVVVVILLSASLTLPLRWFNPVTTAFMLRDTSGRESLSHEWVEWEQMGSAVALAVVAAEDQRFSEHFGLDLASIKKSLDNAERRGGLRGASTISQQVSKNLYLWSGRSFVRKGLEAWLALNLELFLPKRRILEIYLNIAEFGPGVYGAGAASRYFFNKRVWQLGDSEAALLAAVLPNPKRLRVANPSPYVRERQVWIYGQMQRLRRESWLFTIN